MTARAIATGRPTWACLSTAGLKAVLVPPFVRKLLIAADGDEAGRAAAQAAGARWVRAGYRVRVADPGDGEDFNSLLQRGGP